MKQAGWLLDASVNHERRALTLWIKVDGKTQGYTYYKFHPQLFVGTSALDNQDWTEKSLLRSVLTHEDVVKVDIALKFTRVYDEEPSRVLRVYTEVGAQHSVARDLERLPDSIVFHADIDPVQQFFIDSEIFPFGRVVFETNNDVVTHIECIESREDVEYDTPDLEEVGIEVLIDSESLFPQLSDPIHHIEIYNRGQVTRIEHDNELEMLVGLQREIERIDPDVIVTRGGDDHLFRYLSLRAKVNDVALVFSRNGNALNVTEKEPNIFWQYNQIAYRSGNQVMFDGRLHIDRRESLYYSPSGMDGVIEGCRLAFSRPQRVARMSIGSVNAAVQYYAAHQMNILIPPVKRNPEYLKSVNELATIDRGGLIFQPRPGIYENVAEVDFASMYPTLMVTRNISPETICTRTQCPYNYRYCVDIRHKLPNL